MMESRAKFMGHPVHPMLIVFPLGLLMTSLIFDIIYLSTADVTFAGTSYYMIAAGIIGGILAAIFGVVDYSAIPRGTRAKRIALWHGAGNAVVLAIFACSWALRRNNPIDPGTVPVVLSFIGVLMGAVTGWLGGELVDRLGVGVDPGANVNAVSSLEQRTLKPSSTSRRDDDQEEPLPKRIRPSA